METLIVNENLELFDTLDFDVFSGHDWDNLAQSHSQDIIVHWPDGRQTKGLERHIDDLKALFAYAPDTQIKAHPIRFGVPGGVASSSAQAPDGSIEVRSLDSEDGYTCVTGVMTGTFSEPMAIGEGKFIQPTGKSYSVPMCTIGRWRDGVMIEEWLYWDNATFMKQIGLSQ